MNNRDKAYFLLKSQWESVYGKPLPKDIRKRFIKTLKELDKPAK